MLTMGLFRRPPQPPPGPAAPAGGDGEALGWDAIDAALAALYGSQQPRHVGYHPPAALSTNLQGCSAYRNDGHWHYVSYGLSSLYHPEPDDDPAISGWGFELTLRVPATGPADEPPGWAFTMINEIAKQVNGNAVALAVGHRLDLRAPVTGYPDLPDAPPTGLTVFAVSDDPQLAPIDTPNGTVRFLQLVGVTPAEKDEMVDTRTVDVLQRLARDNPLLVTVPDRAPAGPCG